MKKQKLMRLEAQKKPVLYDPLLHENSQKIHQPQTRKIFSKTSTQFKLKRSQNQFQVKENNIYFPNYNDYGLEKPKSQGRSTASYQVQSRQYKVYKQNSGEYYNPDNNFQDPNLFPQSKTQGNFYQNKSQGTTYTTNFPRAATTNQGQQNKRKMMQIQSPQSYGDTRYNRQWKRTQDNEEMPETALSWKNMKKYCKELIDHPRLFYSISNLGFQNYKYPRPPIMKDRMEKYIKKMPQTAQTQSKTPSNIHNQINSIEDICVSKYRPDQYEDIRYSHIQFQDPIKQNVRDVNGMNVENKFQQEVDKDRINNNMSSLEFNIRKKHMKKPPKVRKDRKCGKLDEKTQFYSMKRDLQKSLEESNNIFLSTLKSVKDQQNSPKLRHVSLKNQRVESDIVDLVDQDQSPLKVEPSKQENSNSNNNKENNKTEGGQLGKQKQLLQQQHIFNKQNLYPRVPGSKAKKINEGIETYNKLVKISNQLVMNSQNQAISQVQQEATSEEQQKQLQNLSMKSKIENVLLLSIFVENYSVLRDNKRAITQRILLVLDLNPNDDFYPVSLEKFMRFNTILIHRTASMKEIALFVEQFFKLDDQQLSVQDFKSILRTLTLSIDQRHKDVSKSLYEFMIEHFIQNNTIDNDQELINEDRFSESLLLNKENTLDILDLICGMH